MKKIKNNELAIMIESLDSLADQRLKTRTSLAIAKSVNNLSESHEVYQKARKTIVESYAKKDDKGKCELVSREIAGKSVQEYQFKDDIDKNECMIKASELDTLDSDVNLSYISEADIEAEENLSPMQAAVLLLLVKK